MQTAPLNRRGGVLILEITGESYSGSFGDGAGMDFGELGGFGGGDFDFGSFDTTGMGGFGGGNCATNIAGGLIDTDAGFTITGGVLLAFGDYTEDIPDCSATEFTSDYYYGSENAAFNPSYKGSSILYGGEVTSIAVVDVSGMNSITFPNGKVYMYR